MQVFIFANDAMFYACDNDLNNLIKWLEHEAFLTLECFERVFVFPGPDRGP